MVEYLTQFITAIKSNPWAFIAFVSFEIGIHAVLYDTIYFFYSRIRREKECDSKK